MGRRRHGDHDDLLLKASGPGGAATATAVRARGGTNVHDHVLHLQRDFGNAAVTGVVVQRRPKAASTDAPGYKKKAPVKKKAEPVVEDFRPKTGSKEYTPSKWPDERIEGWLKDHEADAKGLDLKSMGAMREELYYRHPDWRRGLDLYRIFNRIGDKKKADFWLAWFNSKGHLLDAKPEDMSDKAF